MSQTNPALQLLLDFQQQRYQLFQQLFEALEQYLPRSLVGQLQLAIQAEIEPDKRQIINQKLLSLHQPLTTVQEMPVQDVQPFVQQNEKKRRRGFDGGDPADQLAQNQQEKCTFAYDSIEESAIADKMGKNFVFAQRNEDGFIGIDHEFSADNTLKYYNGVGSFQVGGQPVDVFFGTIRVRGDQ